MAPPAELKVLFFDTFGTTVSQRGPVADALWSAAQEALQSNHHLDNEIRKKVSEMDWDDFGNIWNKEEDVIRRELKAKTGTIDWKVVDQHRIAALPKLLADRGLLVLERDPNLSTRSAAAGSLWNDEQLDHLGRIWHRLTPWPDTCEGLNLLNKKFKTAALSNTYQELLEGLVSYSNIPFTAVFSSELFQSFKPNPKVYLGAAEKMGVEPSECALVAAHLGDLKAAKACGFYAISVERPLEEKQPALKAENIPDLVIGEDENGFIDLAEKLGISRNT